MAAITHSVKAQGGIEQPSVATRRLLGQAATEYLVTMGVVLMIALICVGLLVWPTGTTKDAKKQQTDIHFKINEIGTQVEDDSYQSITQGLVGYWKFDEGSGTTAADSRGGYTGTLTNGPTWVTGKSGQAVNFDSVNDYINVGSSASLNTPNAVTVSAWVFPSLSGSITIVSKGAGNSTTMDYNFGAEPNGGLHFRSYNINNDWTWHGAAISANAVTAGSWQHVVGTFDGTTWKIYVNGALKNTTTDAVTMPTGGGLRIGSYSFAGPALFFNGTIDEVMIFNRALSANEIRLLYENPGYPQ